MWLLILLLIGHASLAWLEEPAPVLLLHVVRLEPGTEQVLALELTTGPFRPGTRDDVTVEMLTKQPSKTPEKEVGLNGPGFYPVAEGIEMKWHKTGLTVRAAKNAAVGPRDLRIRYTPFAGKVHVTGLRILVEKK